MAVPRYRDSAGRDDSPEDLPPIHEVTAEEGWALLERQAQERLGMTAEEFIKRWEAGEIEDPDRTDVLMVAFLIPFAR
jgi:hypothetical protein